MNSEPLSDLTLVGQVHEWVEVLPGYQRDTLIALLDGRPPTDVIAIWLQNTGPSDTAPFGGVRVAAQNFYVNLLREIKKALCDGDEAYRDDRQKLAAASQDGGKLILVGTVSTVIAPHVGAAAAVIGPAVAITFGILSNAGKATLCEALTDLIDRTELANGETSSPDPS